MELVLIDAIGPFFRGYDRRRINWSKIPFRHLATSGESAEPQWAAIHDDMDRFARKARELGCTAVTLDDVAHLTDHPWYEPAIREEIAFFREKFRSLFALLRGHGLRIFVTSDYLTTSRAVDAHIGRSPARAAAFYRELTGKFLADFPEVDGVILRIGESDGLDVEDALRSRLVLRTATEVNRFLRQLLPVFESHGRTLIFRTWTVGAHLIGDLIWHRGRLAQALKGITSPAFILSMKYGESDFFRYLSLNRHFFRIDLPKIIEFQARREYEGAGEYPSFIGWECERYARELAAAPNVIGISIWCQTGGWHAFRRLAFLDETSVWIELNVAAAIGVFHEGRSAEEVVTSFFGEERAAAALEFLRLAEIVIRELLYVEEYACQRLYFRRVRIPPLLHVYWDCIFINDATRKVLSYFVHDPERAIRAGEAAFRSFDRMEALAVELELPAEDVRFMRDTFELILLARRYYLLPFDPAFAEQIELAKKAYKRRWPRSVRQRYRIKTSFQPFHVTRRTIAWVSRLVVRKRQGYRTVFDRLFTLRVLSWIYLLFRVRHQKALPKFLRESAMGVDALFR